MQSQTCILSSCLIEGLGFCWFVLGSASPIINQEVECHFSGHPLDIWEEECFAEMYRGWVSRWGTQMEDTEPHLNWALFNSMFLKPFSRTSISLSIKITLGPGFVGVGMLYHSVSPEPQERRLSTQPILGG